MSEFNFTPKFSEEPLDETPVGSLSQYIQKHLESRKSGNQEVFQGGRGRLPNSFGHKAHLPNGMVLDAVDTELASSHLAQYLPTAKTRIFIKKEWIEKALENVEKALSIYENDLSEEAIIEQKALLMRKNILLEKLTAIENETASLNPFQSAYKTLEGWFASKAPSKNASEKGWVFFKNEQQVLQDEALEIQTKLAKLENRLETHFHDPNLTPEDLTKMINEFDKLAAQAEKKIAYLKQNPDLKHKIADWFKA